MSTNYHQEKLKELFKQVLPMGAIGQIMLQTVKDVLPQGENLVACYYQLEYSEAGLGGSGQPTFYSSVVQLLTTHTFIDLGFYPKYHSQRIAAVSAIHDLRLENTFVTGFEGEEVTAEETGYKPVQTKVTVALAGGGGQAVETWLIEATRPGQIDNAQEVYKALTRIVGRPLAEVHS